MSFYRYLLLPAVCLFCLTCLVACENNAPADQLTVVQGAVSSADTGRPLPGVLIAVESFSKGFYGAMGFTPTGDSMRTDAQGKYQLSFRNRKGLYYAVSLEPFIDGKSYAYRYAFAATQSVGNIPGYGPNVYELTLGRTNKVDFIPNELRTVAVRIHNRNTGYQRLDFNYSNLHGNNLDTLAYLRSFYLPATGVKFQYYNVNTTGTPVKDTTVALVIQNPAALPPDTLRATLTFVR